ncbi:unnamed protein product [Vitrella brassicaformis CCMP3155]|uniref:Uncharacterized protein n=1 Tax=Vitrella brassicaformis (strain CCMP3155) TaxID=1169540 RepID=A0A0G4GAJ3_VITBC|nr:unnamed protein product [Vitrella brassicaformis CCMP3155]|eukprot:CEM25988.1 unnamed protein product [Vitrella brassicaformis CCMP3155]
MELFQFGLLFLLTAIGSAGTGYHSYSFGAAGRVQIVEIWLPLEEYFGCVKETRQKKDSDTKKQSKASPFAVADESGVAEEEQAKVPDDGPYGTWLSDVVWRKDEGGQEDKQEGAAKRKSYKRTKTAKEQMEADNRPKESVFMLMCLLRRDLDKLVTIKPAKDKRGLVVKDKDGNVRRDYHLETDQEKEARDKKEKEEKEKAQAEFDFFDTVGTQNKEADASKDDKKGDIVQQRVLPSKLTPTNPWS